MFSLGYNFVHMFNWLWVPYFVGRDISYLFFCFSFSIIYGPFLSAHFRTIFRVLLSVNNRKKKTQTAQAISVHPLYIFIPFYGQRMFFFRLIKLNRFNAAIPTNTKLATRKRNEKSHKIYGPFGRHKTRKQTKVKFVWTVEETHTYE